MDSASLRIIQNYLKQNDLKQDEINQSNDSRINFCNSENYDSDDAFHTKNKRYYIIDKNKTVSAARYRNNDSIKDKCCEDIKIAICGKMGTGKSHLAEYLKNYYGFYITSFAKRLKQLAKELFNMTGKDRGLLIDFATKMRDIDKAVWIRAMFCSIQNKEDIVIDDLRLKNEYETLFQNGWILVKLDTDENIRIQQLQNKYGEKYNMHHQHFNSITENDVVNLNDECFHFVIKNGDYSNLINYIESKNYYSLI
tara:strand:- start:3838 stop:4596 length:759 start_codon:yes stop_codon:yes gene_type:complete